MEVDPAATGLTGVLAAFAWFALRRLFSRIADRVEIVILAAIERNRRRERRERRRHELPPGRRPQTRNEFEGEESTDIFELIEEEREQRARRKTDRQQRRGERAPRPGTHHDEG